MFELASKSEQIR